jgi:predicted metalloprotease with PDZ domain
MRVDGVWRYQSMRKQWLPLMIVAAVLLASPLLAGDEEKEKKYCTNKVEDCVRSMQEQFSTRGWVGINMEANEEAGGVVLTWISPNSPAEEAGLKKGDLLTSLNGIPYDEANEENLKAEYKSFRPGSIATFGVERNGEAMEIAVTLEPMPEEILAKWIGEHVLHYHGEEYSDHVD